MPNKLYNGFKLIIGGSFTILGGLVFFLTGSLLNRIEIMLTNPNNPISNQEAMAYITTFKEAHTYSIILIVIGIIISMHAVMKLFQANFEEASENKIY